MKIAILGTRGIPNNYGGFEQFAEYLSVGLVDLGMDVYVYNSHNHIYQDKEWKKVKIIHKYDPEYLIGTAGQFIYDLNCILDSRKRDFDIILQLGYTSSSIWSFLFPKKSIIITNMDGLEWKRTKYSKLIQRFLAYAEKLAVKKSDYLIADSIGIKNYLNEKYRVNSEYIPYGATPFETPNIDYLLKYGLTSHNYNMLIARLEPENNIETILDGHMQANSDKVFIVIANFNNNYGLFLKDKYKSCSTISFIGAIYDINELNNLRYYSNIYFHGHSVGGTNPSLLEAMASQALIAAHQNEFNSSILNADALYFNNAKDVASIITNTDKLGNHDDKVKANLIKIKTLYTWSKIINSYKDCFLTKRK